MAGYIKVDFKKTAAYLKNLNRDQIPFAAAVTLTRIAQGAQKKIQRGMGTPFKLRSARRLKGGVRIKAARKKDFKRGTMSSTVRHIDRFMALHAVGGTKTAGRHKHVAIPTRELLAKGPRTATGKIKTRFKPKRIISKIKGHRSNPRKRKWGRHRIPARPFIMEVAGVPLIAQRTGPGQYPLRYLWGMQRKATIKATWPFIEQAEAFANKNFQGIFSHEFKRALLRATSKK